MPITRNELQIADQRARELEPVTEYQRVLTDALIEDFEQFLDELAGDRANRGSRDHFEYDARTQDLVGTLAFLEQRIEASHEARR